MVTVEDAAIRLAELVDEVSATGEPAVLTKAGRAVARLMPIGPSREPSEGLIDFLRDWRAEYPQPDDQLAEVIAESRRGVRPARNPLTPRLQA